MQCVSFLLLLLWVLLQNLARLITLVLQRLGRRAHVLGLGERVGHHGHVDREVVQPGRIELLLRR